MNLTVAQIELFVLDGEENIVGKGENAGYQHFILFRQCISGTPLIIQCKFTQIIRDCTYIHIRSLLQTKVSIGVGTIILNPIAKLRFFNLYFDLDSYSPTILKNILCVLVKDLQIGM